MGLSFPTMSTMINPHLNHGNKIASESESNHLFLQPPNNHHSSGNNGTGYRTSKETAQGLSKEPQPAPQNSSLSKSSLTKFNPPDAGSRLYSLSVAAEQRDKGRQQGSLHSA